MAVDALHLTVVLVDCAFQQAIELAAVLGHGEAFEAAGALQVEGRHLLRRIAGQLQQGVVRRHDRLAVERGREDVGQVAVRIELQQIRTEFVAEPEAVGDRLDRFDVEVGAGQVARIRALEDDREGGLLVRVGQEQILDDIDLAVVPVELELVQEQHGVAGVLLGAEAVVRQRPEGAVRHGLDAGEALHRLAVEGQLQVGHAGAVHARNRAEGFGALAVRRRELAGCFQEIRRIGRCRDNGVGRQDGLRGQLCGKLRFIGLRRGGNQNKKCRGSEKNSGHRVTLLTGIGKNNPRLTGELCR